MNTLRPASDLSVVIHFLLPISQNLRYHKIVFWCCTITDNITMDLPLSYCMGGFADGGRRIPKGKPVLPQIAAWEFGAIPERINCTNGRRRSSPNHQRQNPSPAVERDHDRDSRSTLSRTRDADILSNRHEEGRKSYSRQETYEGYLKKWVGPRWGAHRLADVKSGPAGTVVEELYLSRVAARRRSETL